MDKQTDSRHAQMVCRQVGRQTGKQPEKEKSNIPGSLDWTERIVNSTQRLVIYNEPQASSHILAR